MKAIERLSIKIRLYRTSLSITQQEMATTLGLSLRTFQRIETGQSPIDMDIIYKICESYEIPFFDLVNPDIKAENLKEAQFFSDLETFKRENFFSDKTDLLDMKDLILDSLKKDPTKLTPIINLPEFENSPYYLYVSNLHFTIGNAKARSTGGLSDDKHRTVKTFKDASIMIKSWDIYLKNNYPAFKLISEHKTEKAQLKIMAYNFCDYVDSDKKEPIIFGAFELL